MSRILLSISCSLALLSSCSAFMVQPKSASTTTALHMGLFDGVKDAFSAPALERSVIDSERETPIDRWFGWSVVSDEQQASAMTATPANFIDSMDATNYAAVSLSKPMGIVFEENEEEFGGIFVQSLKEGGAAAETSNVSPGDQLVMVSSENVAGLSFDDALGKIVECDDERVKLVFFRGNAEQLYGPTGASKEWLVDFCAKGGVQV